MSETAYINKLKKIQSILAQDGGVLNLLTSNEQTGAGPIDATYSILRNINANIPKFKYSQEITDLTNYLLSRIKEMIMHPSKIEDNIKFSFIPMKLDEQGKYVIDRKNEILSIFCNFLKKLIPRRSTQSNDQIIDDLLDTKKLLINMAEISISITRDIIEMAKPMVQLAIKTYNMAEKYIEDKAKESSKPVEQSGGILPLIPILAAIVIIVVVIIIAIILITAIITSAIVLIQYSPVINNTISGLMLSFNNVISNLIILRLSKKPEHKELAIAYLEKYDPQKALGELRGITDKSLDVTRELGKQSLESVTDIGVAGLSATSAVGTSALGMPIMNGGFDINKIKDEIFDAMKDTKSMINFILIKSKEFYNLREQNKTLDRIFSTFGVTYNIIENIMENITIFIYLQMESQFEMYKGLFIKKIVEPIEIQTTSIREKISNIAQIPSNIYMRLIDKYPASFFASFIHASKILKEIGIRKEADGTIIATIITIHPEITYKLDEIIRASTITIKINEKQTGGENEYKHKYMKAKKEYIQEKQKYLKQQ